MRRLVPIAIAATAAVCTFTSSDVGAQEAPPHGHRTVLSVQPLSAILTVYAAELEYAASPTFSLGLGGTFWDFDDDDTEEELSYTSGDLKLRYYPSGRALQGFAFGGSVGYTRVEARDTDGTTGDASGPSLGVLLDYAWLLNDQRSFYIGIGAGAKVLFIDEDDVDDDDFTARYPTVRFSVGWAF